MKYVVAAFILFSQAPGLLPQFGNGAAVSGEIRSPEGQPLGGVTVSVVFSATQNGRTTSQPLGISLPKTVAQTDASGHYRLENIPAGRYYILATGNSVQPAEVLHRFIYPLYTQASPPFRRQHNWRCRGLPTSAASISRYYVHRP